MESVLPPTVRSADASDYGFFLRCLGELASDDPVPSDGRWLASFAPHSLVLEAQGDRVGYGLAWRIGSWAHVAHVVVHRDWRGRGLGAQVMRALADDLRRKGCNHWRLHVRPGNEAALRLYRGVGLSEVFSAWSTWLERDSVSRLPAADTAWARVEIEPAEDEALEARWNLLPGVIARARTSGRHLVRLRSPTQADDPAPALAVFDPTYPGASVFRCRAPSFVRPLVTELLAATPADDLRISIFVEEDASLARLLLDAGATLRMETLQMRGSIPSDTEK